MPEAEERRCPLCGASVQGRKLKDRDLYIFPDHEGCGPFSTTLSGIAMLTMENAERERLAALVRKAKADDKPSPHI